MVQTIELKGLLVYSSYKHWIINIATHYASNTACQATVRNTVTNEPHFGF